MAILTSNAFMFYYVDFSLGQFNKDKFGAFFIHVFFVSYFIVREAFKIRDKWVCFLDNGKWIVSQLVYTTKGKLRDYAECKWYNLNFY